MEWMSHHMHMRGAYSSCDLTCSAVAIINFGLSMISIWSLPEVHHASNKKWHRRLLEDVDWVVSPDHSLSYPLRVPLTMLLRAC